MAETRGPSEYRNRIMTSTATVIDSSRAFSPMIVPCLNISPHLIDCSGGGGEPRVEAGEAGLDRPDVPQPGGEGEVLSGPGLLQEDLQ